MMVISELALRGRGIRIAEMRLSEVYDYCDLHETHAKRYPLHRKNSDWQPMTPNTKPVVTVGEDKRIIQLQVAEYYTDLGTDYTLVSTKLIARRFHTRYLNLNWKNSLMRRSNRRM